MFTTIERKVKIVLNLNKQFMIFDCIKRNQTKQQLFDKCDLLLSLFHSLNFQTSSVMCNLSGMSRFQLFKAWSQVNGTFLLGIVEFMSLK